MSLEDIGHPHPAILSGLPSQPSPLQELEQLEDFFENAAVGLHLVGPDGTILRANQAELDLLGYHADEYVGRNITEFHADAPVIADILKRLAAGKKLERYPARLRARDGSIKDVEITSNVQFRDGKFINTRCFTFDVTDSKRTNALLRETDQRFAATSEHADIAITEIDAEGKRLRANKAACDIMGLPREKLIGGSPYALLHPDEDNEDFIQHNRMVAGEIDRYAIENRYLRGDGKVIHLDVACSAVRDAYGRFLYSVRVFRDVTAERLAAEKLRESEEKMRQLMEALPAAVYTTDANGRINFYNQAAVEMSGRTPRLGTDEWCVTWKLYQPDGTPMPHDQCPMATAIKEGKPVRGVEAVAERPDGSRVPFIPYPTPLRDDKGNVVGAINMLVDISERKEAEANQHILLAELNHRVKNNMQMMHSFLRTAQRETQNEQARAVLANATERIGAMAAAQQVLYSAGTTMGFSARNFVEAVCASSRDALGENATLTIADCTDASLPNDTAMPLALILYELIANAAKHGKNGKNGDNGAAIRLSLAQQGDAFVLTVEDDGPGFAFEQVRRRSSGLGLVLGLTRQLGGEFTVESGGGARCIVKFGK
jgi:PAS domain S-box-containing protein